MKIFVEGRNFVVSDRIRNYVEEKIGRLDRFLGDIQNAKVEISQEKTKSRKDRNIVQVTVRANGKILRAEDRSEAIYASIDTVADKIHRQVARYKGKRLKRWHGHGQQVSDLEMMPDLTAETWGELEQEQTRKVVRVKRFELAPMSQEEAVEQMELLGHDFFVFFNGDAGRVNVLYRRDDNNYGVIDPEIA